MTKLFTIGDSISQGFRSGAAANTGQSYSTLLARKQGLFPGYAFPEVWEHGGLPVNIEDVLRALNERYGTNIRGIEWFAALRTINNVLDIVEDYYERGAGRETVKAPNGISSYHNVAVRGFDVADAWNVTSALSLQNIRKENLTSGGDDPLFGMPNASLYRTAQKVLNPSLAKQFDDFSQLSWLNHHVTKQGGVENLCLWLGANNALGTVLNLEISQTPGDGSPAGMSHNERIDKKWNLWHPNDFKVEYKLLLDQVDAVMKQNTDPNWKVFIGTVPFVSIAPFLKGVGPTTEIDGDLYFKYYTYFPFTEEFAYKNDRHLTINQVLHIDHCIAAYNEFIKSEVDRLNSSYGLDKHYYIVDIAKALHDMAWKRNSGMPPYPFPEYFEFVYPRIDTKYYHVSANGTMKQGGIFSLDGVHPSAIGQGLIAHEFIKEMQKAGVSILPFTDNEWASIFASDTLYSKPITLMGELYEHEKLADFILQTSMKFKD